MVRPDSWKHCDITGNFGAWKFNRASARHQRRWLADSYLSPKPPPSRLPIVPRVSAPAPTWDCGNGASVIGVHNPTGERQSAISTITRTGAAAGNAARPTSGATGVGSGLSDGSDVQVSTFPNSRYAHPVLGLAITPWPVDSGALHFR
jgi:hypothetical protein